MSQKLALDRRAFLKSAGMTALATGAWSAAMSSTARAAAAGYDFDEVYNRVGTDCYKWDKQIDEFGKDKIVVPMGIADMDFRTAPPVTEALRKRIEHENFGYLRLPASYKESIVHWNRTRYGEEIRPDQILNATGVNPALMSAIRAFAPPGSKVILQAPDYETFYKTVPRAKCLVEENPLKLENGRYSMDFEDLERRIDHDTNVLILCNPQNPTGNCWSAEDLLTLGEICTRRRVVVLSDEIHCDFVNRGEKYTPYSTLDNEEVVMNSITFKSTSKSFNLPATRCAYMYSMNADYLDRVRATAHNEFVNTLGIVASQAAYEEGAEWLDRLVEYIDGNMDFAASYIEKEIPQIAWVKPQGTYLAWLDMSEFQEKIGAAERAALENRDRDPALPPLAPEHITQRYLVEHAGVHLNDGFRYGHGGSGHMRMNLATSRTLVRTALDNLAGAIRAA